MITHICTCVCFFYSEEQSSFYLHSSRAAPHCSPNCSFRHSPDSANLTITWVFIPESSILLAKAPFKPTGKAQRADISLVAFISQASPLAVGIWALFLWHWLYAPVPWRTCSYWRTRPGCSQIMICSPCQRQCEIFP